MNARTTHVARRRVAALAVAGAVAATLGLAGCGSSSSSGGSSTTTTSSPSSSASVTVSNPYVNEPSVPDKTGAFALLKNSAAAEISLTKASVPADMAKVVQLHNTAMVDGEMKMQEVSSIPIPANGELQLKSSGYHIMLMEPKVTLGQMVPLTLTFSDGSTVTADAMVKAPQPMPSMSGSMDMSMSPSMSMSMS